MSFLNSSSVEMLAHAEYRSGLGHMFLLHALLLVIRTESQPGHSQNQKWIPRTKELTSKLEETFN